MALSQSREIGIREETLKELFHALDIHESGSLDAKQLLVLRTAKNIDPELVLALQDVRPGDEVGEQLFAQMLLGIHKSNPVAFCSAVRSATRTVAQMRKANTQNVREQQDRSPQKWATSKVSKSPSVSLLETQGELEELRIKYAKKSEELASAQLEAEALRNAAEIANLKIASIIPFKDAVLRPADILMGIDQLKYEFDKRDVVTLKLTDELQTATREAVQLKQQIELNADELVWLRKDSGLKGNEVNKQSMELEKLKSDLGKTKSQLEFLREEKQTMVKELSTLRAQTYEFSTDAEKANMVISQILGTIDPILSNNKVSTAVSILKDELERRELVSMKMKAGVANYTEELERLRPATKQKDEEIMWLRKEVENKNREMHAKEQECERLRNAFERNTAELSKVTNELEEREDELLKAKSSLANLYADSEAAGLVLAELFQNAEPLPQQGQLRSVAAGLQKVKANKQRQDMIVMSLSKELERTKKDAQHLQEKLDRAENAESSLEMELAEAKVKLDARKAEQRQMRYEAKRREAELEAYNQKLIGLDVEFREKQELHHDDLRNLTALRFELAEQADEIQGRGAEISRLNTLIAQRSQELQECRNELADAVAARDVQSLQVKELARQLGMLQNELSDKDGISVREASEKRFMKVQLDESSRKLVEVQRELDKMPMLEASLESRDAHVRLVQKSNMTNQLERSRNMMELTRVKEQLTTRDTLLRSYSIDVARLNQERLRLEANIRSLTSTLKKNNLPLPELKVERTADADVVDEAEKHLNIKLELDREKQLSKELSGFALERQIQAEEWMSSQLEEMKTVLTKFKADVVSENAQQNRLAGDPQRVQAEKRELENAIQQLKKAIEDELKQMKLRRDEVETKFGWSSKREQIP